MSVTLFVHDTYIILRRIAKKMEFSPKKGRISIERVDWKRNKMYVCKGKTKSGDRKNRLEHFKTYQGLKKKQI